MSTLRNAFFSKEASGFTADLYQLQAHNYLTKAARFGGLVGRVNKAVRGGPSNAELMEALMRSGAVKKPLGRRASEWGKRNVLLPLGLMGLGAGGALGGLAAAGGDLSPISPV